MKTNKTLYGMLAFGPMILLIIGFLGIVAAAIGDAGTHHREPPATFWLFLAIVILGSILSFVTLIMYIVHISRNTRIDDGTRIGWIVGIVFLSGIIPIVYFFVHIMNQPVEEQSVAYQQQQQTKGPWD